MGKDYVPLALNHMKNSRAWKEAIKRLYWSGRVTDASKESYFRVLPPIEEIKEINLGDAEMGTKETSFRFNDETFAVVKGTISLKKLKEVV